MVGFLVRVAVFVLSALFASSLVSAGDFYLISRDSCPGCVVMKGRIPKSVRVLDYDRDPLAKMLHRGSLIPQLVYVPGPQSPASRITGVFSREEVERWMESVDPGKGR